jgi:M6 family metalloprotease-like protein
MRGKRQDFVKRWFAVILVVMAALSFNSFVQAVVANPTPYDVIQADGQHIKVVQRGDEWNNWIETMEGYAIEKDSHGWWVYTGTSHIKEGGLVVGFDDPTGLVEKHFRAETREVPYSARFHGYPSQITLPANQRVLVILVKFSNQSSIGTIPSNWENKVFIDPNNSLRSYYSEISYGQFSIVPASESYGTPNDGIVGWLNLGYNHPDTRSSNNTDNRNRQLTKNAILAADPYVNFSTFDTNGDSYISVTELSIIVVAAGYECAYGGYTPSLWAHKWSLGWTVPAPTCDGVKVAEWMGPGDAKTGGYSQMGEWHQSSPTDGHMATIGVMAHEFGHDALNLPDLYDTTFSSSGIGGFGLMGYGCWGQKSTDPYIGITPVHMCPGSKVFCGFVNPKIPVYGRTNFFTEVSTTPDIYIIPTLDPNQYFMVENRQLTGYDEGLWLWFQSTTGGGLAIWHIDMTKLWNGNNDNANNYLVDLEQADGQRHLNLNLNQGHNQDLFYQGNNIALTDSTVPNSKLYDGTSTYISIASISTSQTTMSANFSGLDIQLQGSRGTERAFIIQRDYGILTITVDNKVQMPVANYNVLRQEGTQQVQVGTIPGSNIQNLVPYTYIDKYLEKGKTYKYVIEAYLPTGTLTAVSNDSSSI